MPWLLPLLGIGLGLTAAGTAYNIFSNERQRNDQLEVNRLNWNRSQQLTKQQWERDDNAVQRRAEDLRAAGMSPILAAGSPAQSSAPIKAEAHGTSNHMIDNSLAEQMIKSASVYNDYTRTGIERQLKDNQIKMANEDNRRQNEIHVEKLKELRFANQVRQDRYDHEAWTWNRERSRYQWETNEQERENIRFAREGESWAIELAGRHQDLLTAELRTERENHEYERILGQGGREVENHTYNMIMNLLRANGRATSDWMQRDIRELSAISIRTRRPYENIIDGMIRVARERGYHASIIDHLEWTKRMRSRNE